MQKQIDKAFAPFGALLFGFRDKREGEAAAPPQSRVPGDARSAKIEPCYLDDGNAARDSSALLP